MRDAFDEIKSLDAVLLAVDPHDEWASKSLLKDSGFSTDEVSFPLLLDPSQTVSATYGVAFQMRIHTEISNRPATFIIDKDGVVQYALRARNYGERPSVKKMIDELHKLHSASDSG